MGVLSFGVLVLPLLGDVEETIPETVQSCATIREAPTVLALGGALDTLVGKG